MSMCLSGEKEILQGDHSMFKHFRVCCTLIPASGSNKRTALRGPAATAWGGTSCPCQAFKAS